MIVDGIRHHPDVFCGEDHLVCEASVDVDPEDVKLFADVSIPGPAGLTLSASDVALSGDAVSR